MAIRTAATASAVVRPAISISRRTRANSAACSGVGSGATVSVAMVSVMQGSSSNSGQSLEVTVAGDEGSVRLDRVLAVRRPELSRSRLKALILAGSVTLKGAPIRDPAYHVAAGDTITIDVPEAVAAEPAGEDIALDIVYEDDDIIVIDKPRGLVVHPAAGHETGTLVNALIAHCGASLSGIGGVKRPGIVHRLDKDTTGLMVAAKNDRAHKSLTEQFADHGRTGAMRRGYMAFVWDVPNRQRGTVDAPIDRHPYAREKMAVREGGREAITHWEIQESFHGPRRQAGRGAARLPARDRTHPSDPGASRPYRPSADGRRRLWPALQDQGQPPRPPEPGRLDRPRTPSATRIPSGAGAPQNRGNSALGIGFAGGFASPAENPASDAMTQAVRKSDAMPTGYSSHTGT